MSEWTTEKVRSIMESLVEKGYAWKHEPTGEYGITEKGVKFVEALRRKAGELGIPEDLIPFMLQELNRRVEAED